MKNKSLWILAAIAFGGIMTFTSCKDNEEKTDEEDQTVAIAMPADPTEDPLSVKVEGLTYVLDAAYTGEGAALVRRVTNRTQNIMDPKIQNIILHSSNVSKLTTDEAIAISALLIRGGSLVMVEPRPQEEIALMDKIVETADGCISESIESPLFDSLDYDNLEWLYYWAIQGTETLLADYNVEGNDESLEIMAWRGYLTFKSLNVHENKTYTKSLEGIFTREDGTTEVVPFTVDETVEMTDYLFGLQADECADWMNSSTDIWGQQAKRRAAVKAIATRANESELYIDNIATAQEYNLQLGGIVTFKDGDKTISRYHKVLLTRKVWAAYSYNKKCDYYCVNQTVKLFNQDLQCGPSAPGEWWDSSKWDKWNAATSGHPTAQARVYGPYLSQFGLEVYLKDAKPVIEKSTPVNSTSGGETVSDGINFSLGANLGFTGSNPAAGVNGSVTWTHSVSRVSADLKVTATSDTGRGSLNWQYELNNRPGSEFKLLGANHTNAKDVATKELELQQAWVWSLQSGASTIDLVTDWSMVDQWLSYEKTVTSGRTNEFYLDEKFSNTDLKSQKATQENGFTFDRIQRVACPPRVKENWSMTIEGDDLTGEQKTKVENFLLDHLAQYYSKSLVVYSAKYGHQKAIVNGKTKLETLDELGRKVAKLQRAIENNKNVAELLKLAGKDAGIPATGSYKIVWRNTDENTGGAKYDNEELTIKLSDN